MSRRYRQRDDGWRRREALAGKFLASIVAIRIGFLGVRDDVSTTPLHAVNRRAFRFVRFIDVLGSAWASSAPLD
jgi:ABC-type phosphate/phosphonate transport system permease subunit